MSAPDLTSIKPHMLRAWLGWCAANKLTPLLSAEPLPYIGLPATVLAQSAAQHPGQPLVFNLSQHTAANLGFTGQAILFTTLFPGQRQASSVEIPAIHWKVLRIPELGQRINLAFPEQLLASKRTDANPWPMGSGGIIMPHPQGTDKTVEEPTKPSLVWSSTK